MTGAITFKHLAFTGPSVGLAILEFRSGLNIIYGASNTGKSFTTKAFSFMLGATKTLPRTEEVNGYDAAWLGFTLADGRDLTLYRPTNGGAFKVYDGLRFGGEPKDGTVLRAQADATRIDTISHFLLEVIGLAGKVIVKNANAEKDNLSIRLIAPYVIVSEEDIIAERSPVLYSGQNTSRTFERNLFRLLLTGVDDAAAVTVQSDKVRDVAKNAKVELVDEMIAQLDEELGEEAPDRKELDDQLDKIDTSVKALEENLRKAQITLDNLVKERRGYADTQRDVAYRVAELDITVQRFGRLSEVYRSDIARLEALEEGGFILLAMADRDCPVCGAPPGAQRHNHAAEDIQQAHRAAAAEIAKIQVEQRELRQTIVSLESEAEGLRRRATGLEDDIKAIEARIEAARPQESSARSGYEALAAQKAKLDHIADLYSRRDRLVVRRTQIDGESGTSSDEKLVTGIDGTVAHAFGKTVRQVLEAWGFPGAQDATFSIENNDITIAGKGRAANGKGVRAILHAAFNVAVILFCNEHKLPHPGFLILDTPLLTYRPPFGTRHGELSDDEQALAKTGLAELFYKHLASLKDIAQFIIVENSDPPASISELAHIEIFSGRGGKERAGLFPRRE